MTDEALMAAYQNGDLAAFGELVSRHEKRLWGFLRRFVHDKAAAEDLLQELFLRVVKSAPEWKPTAKVTTWLYAIARNLCIDHARRQEFRKAASLDSAPGRDDSGERPLLDRLPSAERGAEGEVMGREIAARIDRAIANLPLDQREVFLLREVMDLSFPEIAQAVGSNESTVKSRLRYALERLRVTLDELREVSPVVEAAP